MLGNVMPCVVADMKALFSFVAERVGGAKMHVQVTGMTSCIVDSDSSNNSSRADQRFPLLLLQSIV